MLVMFLVCVNDAKGWAGVLTNNTLSRIIKVTLITSNFKNEKLISGTRWKTAVDNSFAANERTNYNPCSTSHVMLSQPCTLSSFIFMWEMASVQCQHGSLWLQSTLPCNKIFTSASTSTIHLWLGSVAVVARKGVTSISAYGCSHFGYIRAAARNLSRTPCPAISRPPHRRGSSAPLRVGTAASNQQQQQQLERLRLCPAQCCQKFGGKMIFIWPQCWATGPQRAIVGYYSLIDKG